MSILSGDQSLKEMPHSDTLNYYMERLSPNYLSQLRKKLVKKLIRMKSFQKGKPLGQYWRILVDGTEPLMKICRDSNAMKNHYLLTQIADIIMQIYLSWSPLRKEIKQSIKNTSSRLLESFRRQTVTGEVNHTHGMWITHLKSALLLGTKKI